MGVREVGQNEKERRRMKRLLFALIAVVVVSAFCMGCAKSEEEKTGDAAKKETPVKKPAADVAE